MPFFIFLVLPTRVGKSKEKRRSLKRQKGRKVGMSSRPAPRDEIKEEKYRRGSIGAEK